MSHHSPVTNTTATATSLAKLPDVQHQQLQGLQLRGQPAQGTVEPQGLRAAQRACEGQYVVVW